MRNGITRRGAALQTVVAILAVTGIYMALPKELLVTILPEKKQTPLELLRSGGALWLTNMLVFALWYWRLRAAQLQQFEASFELFSFFSEPAMSIEY